MTDTRTAAFAADLSSPVPVATVVAAPYAAEGPIVAGTSFTPNSIDTVTLKTFVINEYNRSFFPGTRLRATAADFEDVWLEGLSTAWDGVNVTIDGDLASGAGVYSNWQINVAGEPGQQGPIGSTGPVGPSGGPIGPAGPAGPPGSVWRTGTGAPSNALGVNGDYYLDDASNNYWLRTGGFYAVVGNLGGDQGPVGPAGPTGPQGIIADAPTDGGYYARRNAAWVAPPGGGNVVAVNAPTAGQLARWTSPTTIEGYTAANFAPLNSPVFTGNPQAPTPLVSDSSISLATTAFVKNQGYALLASPTFTGTPIGPTASPGTNTQQLATTAFVAATSAFTTGDLKSTHKTIADAGWIFWVDGTIGDASSGASRANVDTQALFILYYNGYSDANCPLLTSAGAATTRSAQGTAAAAYAAHCRMSLPLGSGRVIGIAGTGSGLTYRQIGQALGEQTHAQTIAEMPSHAHPGANSGLGVTGGGLGGGYAFSPNDINTGLNGGNAPFNIMQPTTFINVMIKL